MFENENHNIPNNLGDYKYVIEKFLTICLPVNVKPCVDVKHVKTVCCGEPIITPKRGMCCKGGENSGCEFTIVQKMKLEIPLEFSTETKIDKPFVDCEFKKDCDDDHKNNHDEHEHDKHYLEGK